MFRPILETLLEKIPGGCFAAVVGEDGIEIQSVRRRWDDASADIVSAEWANFLRSVLTVLKELNAGKLEETTTLTSQFAYHAVSLKEDIFLFLIVRRGLVSVGQARFYMRVAAADCMDALVS